MKKKLNSDKIVDILFWSIIIVMTIIEMYNSGTIAEIASIDFRAISKSEFLVCIIGLIFAFLFTAIFSMLRIFYITIIYFGIKIANKKHYKEKLEKVDFKNDNYYREILPKYSPAVLSYIDDFKIEEKDVVATILNLEVKNKIKINAENITILDENLNDLEEHEKHIMIRIKEGILKEISLLEFEKMVRNDALKKGLLKENENAKKSEKLRIIKSIIIYICVLIGFFMCPEILNNFISDGGIIMILGFILIMILFALMIFMPYTMIVYISHYKALNTLDPYIRSEKAKEINTNLEGLRKYLLEYSQIKDRTKEEITLWDDYLIYSVFLGINTKIVDEVYSKIQKMN